MLGGTKLPIPESDLLESGTLQFRPALCIADPYGPSTHKALPGPLPSACSEQYSLQAPTLITTPSPSSAQGYHSNLDNIAPDPALTTYPSTTPGHNDAEPRRTVLLPVVGGGGLRYLLGPSGLSGSAVASAQALFQNPAWVVNVTLTAMGAVEWNALAQRYFHEIIGIDFDGQLVSAPLTEPTQSEFASFAGRVQISGDFDKRSAEELAANLDSGPLAVPLRVAG